MKCGKYSAIRDELTQPGIVDQKMQLSSRLLTHILNSFEDGFLIRDIEGEDIAS